MQEEKEKRTLYLDRKLNKCKGKELANLLLWIPSIFKDLETDKDTEQVEKDPNGLRALLFIKEMEKNESLIFIGKQKDKN